MSLLDVQSVLARLCTDRDYRQAFRENRRATLTRERLTLTEREQLLTLDLAQVERFAASLRRRRLAVVRELAPATSHALGEGLARLFEQYADLHSPAEGAEEALAFLGFVLDVTLDRPPYLHDVARYEKLRLEVLQAQADARTNSGPTDDAAIGLQARPRLSATGGLMAAGYDLARSYRPLAAGEATHLAPDACHLLLGSVPGSASVRARRINSTTAQVLSQCDGTATLGEIAASAERLMGLSPTDVPRFREELIRVMNGLRAAGLVVISPTPPAPTRTRSS